MEIEKAAIDRVIGAGDESCFVRTQKQGQGGDFFRIRHPANGLRFRKLLKHFLLAAGIILFQIAVHEGSVNARGRDAIAANLVGQIVARHGKGHGQGCALAHGIGKAISEAGGGSDGSHVYDGTAAAGFHGLDSRVHAIVGSLHVDREHSVEVGFGGGFELADVGNAGAVHEDVDGFLRGQCVKYFGHGALITNVADVSRGAATGCSDFLSGGICISFVEINDPHDGAFLRKPLRDGAPDAAGGTGNDGNLAVEAEAFRLLLIVRQRETPLFQGMKSSCESISALVRASPLAT